MQWTYTTKAGDTWDVLAFDIYGSEMLAHVLMAANWNHLHLLFFPAGLTLIVPDIPAFSTNQPQPPWGRKRRANGNT